ncbi:MAG: VanZ family protein, partial [Raoultibacter sp.]
MNKTFMRQKTHTTHFVIISWVLVVAWALFIFFMSSNTGDGLNQGLGVFSGIYRWMQSIQLDLLGPGVDVLSSMAHFCEYAVFGILWANALRCHMSLSKACLLAIVCASLYGVTDEFHQLFVVDRMCDPLDWLIDT